MIDEHPLFAWLESTTPVLLDGAMGTELHSRGFNFDDCLDDLNRSAPDVVLAIHRAYLQAGAQIIETNTFGANRFKLDGHGLEAHVTDINAAAVELARRAVAESGQLALVAGSVGPLGVRLEPFGRVRAEQAFDAFKEQISALVDAGVDLLVLETHSDLYELQEAVRAARAITDLPLVASMTFTRDDRTLLGDTAHHVAEALAVSGADIIGANCSEGPAQLLRLVGKMQAAAPGLPLSVMPNAGWPERVADRIMYPATPDYFSDFAQQAALAGVQLIGGCCGTTPEHIAAMRRALDRLPDGDYPATLVAEVEHGNGDEHEPGPPTELADRLASGRFVIAVEMDPPRGFSTHKVLAGAHLLANAGADVINVADSPMARMRMSPWAVCQLIQREVGVETVLHFPTRGRNLLRVQGDLLASHALGVRNVFVVMGDPTAVGDYPEAMDNYDLVPTGLIKLVKRNFNAGVDHAGADIGGATSFFVGCALNLAAQELDREIALLRKKIDSGADFALTQPVFDPNTAARFFDAYAERFGPLELPVLVGILPLYNDRHAAFLHNEVPGIVIPEPLRVRVQQAGRSARDEGVRIAVELLEALRPHASGMYLMPPFGRYDIGADIVETIQRVTAASP
jgi:methionine synthase I (cobalamin-dependent)/5,10-methylenetetrahydrofolate reductase